MGVERRMRLTLGGAGVLVGCGLALVLGAGVAVADEDLSDGGLWYFTATGMEQAQQQATGAGVTVAVIDSGINPAVPELQGVDLTVHEPAYCLLEGGGTVAAAVNDESAFHGTSMVSLIVGTGVGANGQPGVRGVAPDASVVFYRLAAPACSQSTELNTGDAVRQAVDDGANIINLSYTDERTGRSVRPDDVAYALAHDVIIVAASPHSGGYPAPTYPIAYNGVVGVEGGQPDGQLSDLVVSADFVDVVAPGDDLRALSADNSWSTYTTASGSSGATAYTSGVLALVWSAYPEASANQIVQSLIRNTGPDDHELGWVDRWGYGTVNVRHMLAHDPGEYPDVNPLLTGEGEPTVAQVEAAGAVPSSVPSATSSGQAAGEGGPSVDPQVAESGGGLLVGAGVGVLVLVGLVIATVVVLRRRASSDRAPTDHPPS